VLGHGLSIAFASLPVIAMALVAVAVAVVVTKVLGPRKGG
jgi:hypothetical protein